VARYLLVRLATSVFLLVAITLFVFTAFYVTPANRPPPGLTNDTYRLDGSLPHQYALFLWRIVRHGDLGVGINALPPFVAMIGMPIGVALAGSSSSRSRSGCRGSVGCCARRSCGATCR
jgi:ABC-type dipeptide/oligopeptide/nickel transport system permease component